eukprot:Clim_evm77s150 gene=Clim_evmTU77s150
MAGERNHHGHYLPPEHRENIKVCVLGAGAFGTAMATIAARNHHQVMLLCRDKRQCELINGIRRNPKHLQEFDIPEGVTATTDDDEALKDAKLLIHCIPTQLSYDYLMSKKAKFPKDAILLSTAKGIYVKTEQFMHEVIHSALGPDFRTAYISGPSFAKEMMKNYPTTAVCAAENLEDAKQVQQWLTLNTFRIYTSTDVKGVEIGGALKNPLAIGAGIIQGTGFGYNTMAAFVTRGCKEMRDIADALGGRPETLSGLSGFGDLMLTCFGSLSRNQTVGRRLGAGEKLDDILQSMGEVVEGVPTAAVAAKMCKERGLDCPLFFAIDMFIRGEMDPSKGMKFLMERPLKDEFA